MRSSPTCCLAALLLSLGAAACTPAARTAVAAEPAPRPNASDARAPAGEAERTYTAADVRFMTGMIGHHAQAIVMSRWAPTNGASPTVQTLAARIINSQQDEIAIMQSWLRDRDQPVPDPAGGRQTAMPGMDHGADMPGMLSAEQMKQLEAARGAEFDRLYLRYMIQHHAGALTMVDELFGSTGAAQEPATYKIASDISADQSTEIARMQTLLVPLILESGSP